MKSQIFINFPENIKKYYMLVYKTILIKTTDSIVTRRWYMHCHGFSHAKDAF